jgi:hypothetical protein
MKRYKIVRMYFNDAHPSEVVARDLTRHEAQEWCKDPETSSRTCKLPENVKRTKDKGNWFDGYDEDEEA